MSYLESVVNRTRSTVERWHGMGVAIRELSVTHPTLTIVVSGDDQAKNLVISCLSPVYICGPLRWTENEIVLKTSTLPSGDEGIAVMDEGNGVQVLAESVEVKENVKL